MVLTLAYEIEFAISIHIIFFLCALFVLDMIAPFSYKFLLRSMTDFFHSFACTSIASHLVEEKEAR